MRAGVLLITLLTFTASLTGCLQEESMNSKTCIERSDPPAMLLIGAFTDVLKIAAQRNGKKWNTQSATETQIASRTKQDPLLNNLTRQRTSATLAEEWTSTKLIYR